ncbi:DUF4085 family protein [Clostridium sp. BL-8]|uniref:DUF4085 family protein n=1 Tax=Clostridium sp. BL-8 TaxID=349938 RepID=UPI00098C001F|nr:DUF4085 family protein [Clostridium sp. BL-8]OOM74240.1 hypothetical protein CLOBL_44160 [Clostridium sp. BL-8]
MRYFTSEIYEKTQIRGRFPLRTDNKEKWMHQLDKFYNGGHKHDMVLDALLFKYIPEVKEDILQGKEFTDKEVSQKLYERIKEMANEWKNLCSLYKTEYENIKQKLPLSLQELRNYHFHDNTLLSLKKESNDMLIIELECYILIFKNVIQLETVDDIVGDIWIDEEVHLSDTGGFEFQVLFLASQGLLTLHEFSVIADDIIIRSKDIN